MEWEPIKNRLPLTEKKLMEYDKMNKQQLVAAIIEKDQKIAILSNEEKNTVIATLQEENTSLKTKNSTLQEENETLSTENATKESVIVQLSAKVSQMDASKKGGPEVIEFGGKKYRIALPKLEYNRKVITAADLRSNKELVKELLEIQSGMLVEITK